jgi:hypothetical protein
MIIFTDMPDVIEVKPLSKPKGKTLKSSKETELEKEAALYP